MRPIHAVVSSALLAALALSACGGGGNASRAGETAVNAGADASGPVNAGAGVSGALAFALPPEEFSTSAGSASYAVLAVNISDRPLGEGCAGLGACARAKNATSVEIGVVNYAFSASAPAVGPGTYSVGKGFGAQGGSFASANYATSDGTCVYTATSAVGGTVTIDSISDGKVSGSYDLTLQGLPPVSGTFVASDCSNQVVVRVCPEPWSFQRPTCEGSVTCQ